jgi:CHAD domain-containing protein
MRKLKPKDDAQHALRRYLRRGIRKTLQLLSQEPLTDETVHDIRRQVKKLRAVLRLSRGGMSRKRFRRTNRCLQRAGAPLSELRDAKVLITTWKGLSSGTSIAPGLRESVLAILEARLEEARTHVLEREAVVEDVSTNLRRARKLVSHWPSSGMDMSTIEDGLRRVHSRGCKALGAATSEPSDDGFHELRKRAKDLHNAAGFLEGASRGVIHRLLTATGRVGDLLGDARDLAMLEHAFEGRHLRQLDDRPRVRELASARREPLEREAVRLARRIYTQRVAAQLHRFIRG